MNVEKARRNQEIGEKREIEELVELNVAFVVVARGIVDG